MLNLIAGAITFITINYWKTNDRTKMNFKKSFKNGFAVEARYNYSYKAEAVQRTFRFFIKLGYFYN